MPALDEVILRTWQVSQIKRAVDIGRGDYSEAKYVQKIVYQILDGVNCEESLKEMEEDY